MVRMSKNQRRTWRAARLNSFEHFSTSKIKSPWINFLHLLQKIKHTDLWDEVNGFDLNLKVDHEVML